MCLKNPQLTLSEAVPVINDWKGGVGLIFEMEMAMKSRGLLPSSDNPQNTNFLKFEWQFFGITASKHVCDSSLYILPVPAGDKLFIRYMEKGVYKGFTKKFLPVLMGKYNLTPQDTYLYNIYTDKDMAHESQLNKYQGQTTRGFYQLMYSMCAHTGAPKRFFVIFAKRTVWILIYVDVITFQINLLYFVI